MSGLAHVEAKGKVIADLRLNGPAATDLTKDSPPTMNVSRGTLNFSLFNLGRVE